MTKLEEMLKKWESMAMRPIAYGAGFPDHLILELLQDLRSALVKCSILEWHPANEEPKTYGKKLVHLKSRLSNNPSAPFYVVVRKFMCVDPACGEWELNPWECLVEWTELPERS